MKDPGPAERRQRREFLRAGLRWVATGTVVGVVFEGMHRKADASCFKPNPCGACPLEAGCDRDRARAWRNALEEGRRVP